VPGLRLIVAGAAVASCGAPVAGSGARTASSQHPASRYAIARRGPRCPVAMLAPVHALVTSCVVAAGGGGAAGEIAKVSHTFQPSGRALRSNSR
jgi:hypothetical protein